MSYSAPSDNYDYVNVDAAREQAWEDDAQQPEIVDGWIVEQCSIPPHGDWCKMHSKPWPHRERVREAPVDWRARAEAAEATIARQTGEIESLKLAQTAFLLPAGATIVERLEAAEATIVRLESVTSYLASDMPPSELVLRVRDFDAALEHRTGVS